jgi:hypothetical protein
MQTITLHTKPFGEMAVAVADGLFEYYTLTLGGKEVRFHLHIFENFLNAQTAETVTRFLNEFPVMYAKARAFIAAQADDDDVDYFFRSGVEETDEACLLQLFGVNNTNKITRDAYLAALELRGSHIWQSDKGAVGCVLDFSLDEEYTDELLAVSFGEDCEPVNIAHES